MERTEIPYAFIYISEAYITSLPCQFTRFDPETSPTPPADTNLRPNTLVTGITCKKRYQRRQIGTCRYDQYRW